MTPLHAIEAAVSDILVAAESIEQSILELSDADEWRIALGLTHDAQSRLRDILRTMLNYARAEARNKHP